MPKVIQSNNSKLIGHPFSISKDQIKIGQLWLANKIPLNSVTNARVEIAQHVGKSMGGTIGGAIVGGLLTGGVGAIVGGLACGNNKLTSTRTISIEYGNKDWVVVEFGSSMVDNIVFTATQKLLGTTQPSPFAV